MATTYPQKRRIRPSRIHTLPQGVEDGPWTVGVEENPRDPSSFTIFVRSAYLPVMEILIHFTFSTYGILMGLGLTHLNPESLGF